MGQKPSLPLATLPPSKVEARISLSHTNSSKSKNGRPASRKFFRVKMLSMFLQNKTKSKRQIFGPGSDHAKRKDKPPRVKVLAKKPRCSHRTKLLRVMYSYNPRFMSSM